MPDGVLPDDCGSLGLCRAHEIERHLAVELEHIGVGEGTGLAAHCRR
jgi:hypothetical protein